MRAVQLADIEMAARALLSLPQTQRETAMSDLLWRADIADRYRRRLRRQHAGFGTGTLMSAAAQMPIAPRPARMTQDALHAFSTVINALHHQSA